MIFKLLTASDITSYEINFSCEILSLFYCFFFNEGYDLSPNKEGLYKPPEAKDEKQLRYRTLQKFQSIIASAVANTEGNGKNTYLLLGPIGTGAFANDGKMIAELFHQVLNNSLMQSNQPIRYAFEEIWFVSTKSLSIFQTVFGKT